MKKFKKVASWIALILIAIFLIGTVYDYYRMPLVAFFDVEENDELIKNNARAYIIKKDRYERGDIIIANDVNWKETQINQVSRKIIGLPGEYVESKEGSVLGVSLHDDQYGVHTAVTDQSLTSVFRDVVPEENIYGVIVGDPLTDFKSRFSYFINRTKYIPEYIKLKVSSSYLSLASPAREVPTVSRTIAVVNRNADGFVVDYRVGAGNNLWNIIEEDLLLRNDSKSAQELTVEVDEIKDDLKALSNEELKELGFSSGDVSILMAGDKIKILEILETYMK